MKMITLRSQSVIAASPSRLRRNLAIACLRVTTERPGSRPGRPAPCCYAEMPEADTSMWPIPVTTYVPVTFDLDPARWK